MTRIEVVYNGHGYSIASDDVVELQARILDACAGGPAFWLTVNGGEGTVKAVDLLINASTQISIAAITSE